MNPVLVCPGIHPRNLTVDFLKSLNSVGLPTADWLVFPAERLAPYDGFAIANFLEQQMSFPERAPSITILSYSAGVVGALIAARMWQRRGGQIRQFFAWDGWGAPVTDDFPSFRISHDNFTHRTSCLLGSGCAQFWAEPGVSHHQVWQAPAQIFGYSSTAGRTQHRNLAVQLSQWLTT
ncbi:MAG: hypothetical protein AAGG02_04090 [Cyanobacteria bacterium P01_H01_bin.15]